MKIKLQPNLLAAALVGALAFTSILARAADLSGSVQGAGSPIAGATVTVYAASASAPTQLAQGKTDDNGAFNLAIDSAPANSVIYVVAKGGTPKAAADKGANDAIALLAVLGTTPPTNVVVNEFTTVASAVTCAQFLQGEALSGKNPGLRIAAGNVPNFVSLETGGYGDTIQDALNSTQTPTMANFATLANLLAGCVTRVTPDACSSFFAAATSPTGVVPADTLTAIETILRNPWHKPEPVFALLDQFYPVPKGKNLRPTPFMPYLTWAPSAWVLPLKFTGGGLSAPGKMMFDSEGNLWAGDNFIVGAQNQDALWAGNMTKFAPNGKPLSPMTTGFTGGGVEGVGFGLCVDAEDNCWATCYGSKAIVKFDKTGKPLSPPGGWTFGGRLGMMQGIIATPNGDIWALDIEKGQVIHLPKGDPEKAEFIFVNKTGKPFKNPGKLLAPFSIAIDQQNNIWVGNGAAHWVSRFSADDPTHTLKTFDTGYSISGLAIDSKGNVWIANRLGNSWRGWWSWVQMLFKAKGGGNPDPYLTTTMSKQKPGYWSGGSLTVLSPDGKQLPFSPITGKGLAGPWAVVVDGDDNVWVNNLVNAKCGIVELCGSNAKAWPPGKQMGDAITPKGGYVGGGMQMEVDLDIDPAGNVWVGNNWQNLKSVLSKNAEPLSTLGAGQGVVVFYGVAKPVKTPLIGPVQQL
jgi:hypothetical protein